MSSCAGKVVLVSGASASIGRAAAEALAAEGATVELSDVDEARGEQVARDITDKGGTAAFHHVDVADDASVAELLAWLADRFGGLDAAFNNAGIEGEPAVTGECTVENWQRTLAVDLTGVWSCMRHELPLLLERGGGSIVNCASVAGLVGFATIPAYTAAKHGVVGLTKTAALEYAEQGIRVNAICPGKIDTEMLGRVRGWPAGDTPVLRAQPVGRLGRPEEIADAVVWLCSARSGFVSGQAIAVDGGFVAR